MSHLRPPASRNPLTGARPRTAQITTLVSLIAVVLLFVALSAKRTFATSDAIPLADAIATQRAALAQDPRAAGYNDLGNLLSLAGDQRGAEAAYRSALEIDADQTETLYNLALLLQGRGELSAAAKLFRRVLEKEPDSAWVHFQIGLIQEEKGHHKAAIRSMARAFELDSSLAFPDVNPQLIGNEAATVALLVADVRPTAAVPRLYSNPQRMVTLLTSDLEPDASSSATDEAEVVGGAADATPTPPPRTPATLPAYSEDDETGDPGRPSSSSVLEDESEAAEDFSGDEQGLEEDVEEESGGSRRIDATSLRSPRPGGATTTVPGVPTSRTPSGRDSMSRGDGRSQSATPSSRPAASRFRPGRRSNARIEWNLVPARVEHGDAVAPGH